jgi:uncharacterized protein
MDSQRPRGRPPAPSAVTMPADSVSGPPPESMQPRCERFGYTCNRCSRCCYQQRIQLNPYEVARLARRLGTSTTEFRRRMTVEGAGVELARSPSGACALLGPEGCTVHADRPLVCRLYPLGRVLEADGRESFRRLEGHPESAGLFTERGTIGDYLDAQRAEPFLRAADAYFGWLCRVHEILARSEAAGDAAGGSALDLLDLDQAISAHCRRKGLEEPQDLESRLAMHLEILHGLLEGAADP